MNLSWHNTDYVTFVKSDFLLHELLSCAKGSFSGQFWSSFDILTWDINWSWCNTGQGKLLSRLTYFLLSYFPFKNEVFQIFVSRLLWYRLEICCILTYYRSSLTFDAYKLLKLMAHEFFFFVTIEFSGLFSAVFYDIDIQLGVWICIDIIYFLFILAGFKPP